MSKDGEQRLSKNFLAVHGLDKDGGWSSLSPDKPFVIVKLEEIAEEIGLNHELIQVTLWLASTARVQTQPAAYQG